MYVCCNVETDSIDGLFIARPKLMVYNIRILQGQSRGYILYVNCKVPQSGHCNKHTVFVRLLTGLSPSLQ